MEWVGEELIIGLLIVIAVACIGLWAKAIRRLQHQPDRWLVALLPSTDRQRPNWSPSEFLFAFGVYVLSNALIGQYFISRGWIKPDTESAAAEQAADVTATSAADLETITATVGASLLAGLTTLVTLVIWHALLRRSTFWSSFGRVGRYEWKVGLASSVMILPPVMLINALVSLWVTPYEHPVLTRLAAAPTAGLFVMTFVATAIVTPILEELMFRFFLQGGLQGLFDHPLVSDSESQPRSFAPIWISSGVFALAHFGGQGAAPIPLFFLALALGYVYRQTNSLLVPILVHMVLNSITLTVAYLSLASS